MQNPTLWLRICSFCIVGSFRGVYTADNTHTPRLEAVLIPTNATMDFDELRSFAAPIHTQAEVWLGLLILI